LDQQQRQRARQEQFEAECKQAQMTTMFVTTPLFFILFFVFDISSYWFLAILVVGGLLGSVLANLFCYWRFRRDFGYFPELLGAQAAFKAGTGSYQMVQFENWLQRKIERYCGMDSVE